jgi:hypothetical protein
MNALEWARLPGDLIFIVVGAVRLVIAALKTIFGLYRTPEITRGQEVAGEAGRALLADNAGELPSLR